MSSSRGTTTSSSVRELFPAAPSSHSIGEKFGYRADHARAAWEAGIELPSVDALFEMELGDRVEHLRRIHSWQVDCAIIDGPYQQYRRYEASCKAVVDELTGERCLRPQWGSGPACLTHADLDQLDPDGEERRRKARNKARMAAAAEKGLEFIEDVLADTENEKYPASLRAKVILDVMDRETSTSKKHETKTEISGEVQHTHDVGDKIRAHIDRYASELTEAEIVQMESDFPELTSGDDADE